MLDKRVDLLLRAAIGFVGGSPCLPSTETSTRSAPGLDSCSGIGHVAVRMARQGYDLQLTRYDENGWRATFYTGGMEHSPRSATATGSERTPWRAAQRAAGGGVVTGD